MYLKLKGWCLSLRRLRLRWGEVWPEAERSRLGHAATWTSRVANSQQLYNVKNTSFFNVWVTDQQTGLETRHMTPKRSHTDSNTVQFSLCRERSEQMSNFLKNITHVKHRAENIDFFEWWHIKPGIESKSDPVSQACVLHRLNLLLFQQAGFNGQFQWKSNPCFWLCSSGGFS